MPRVKKKEDSKMRGKQREEYDEKKTPEREREQVESIETQRE